MSFNLFVIIIHLYHSSQKKRFNESADSQLPPPVSDGPPDTLMG